MKVVNWEETGEQVTEEPHPISGDEEVPLVDQYGSGEATGKCDCGEDNRISKLPKRQGFFLKLWLVI